MGHLKKLSILSPGCSPNCDTSWQEITYLSDSKPRFFSSGDNFTDSSWDEEKQIPSYGVHIIVPVFQKWKSRLREIKSLAQGHHGKILGFWPDSGQSHPKAHALCPFKWLEMPLLAWGWDYPLPSFPRAQVPSDCLILLTLGPLSLRKSSRHTWKIKYKSINPHPEIEHPSLCCH